MLQVVRTNFPKVIWQHKASLRVKNKDYLFNSSLHPAFPAPYIINSCYQQTCVEHLLCARLLRGHAFLGVHRTEGNEQITHIPDTLQDGHNFTLEAWGHFIHVFLNCRSVNPSRVSLPLPHAPSWFSSIFLPEQIIFLWLHSWVIPSPVPSGIPTSK